MTNEIPDAANRLAFMHLSLLDELVCFRNEEIESDHLIEIGEKCTRIGLTCEMILNGRKE